MQKEPAPRASAYQGKWYLAAPGDAFYGLGHRCGFGEYSETMDLSILKYGNHHSDPWLRIILFNVQPQQARTGTSVVDFSKLEQRYGYTAQVSSESVTVRDKNGRVLFRCYREDGKSSLPYLIPTLS
jgi:hypothetical protein